MVFVAPFTQCYAPNHAPPSTLDKKKNALAETAVIDNIKTKAHSAGPKANEIGLGQFTARYFLKYRVIDMESMSYPPQIPREL